MYKAHKKYQAVNAEKKTLVWLRTWTHHDAFVQVAVVLGQVHTDPDYTGVSHLTVVHRQGGHGHGAFVLRGLSRFRPSTAARRGWRARRSRGVWRGGRRGAGRGWGRGRGGKGGREGLRHIVARAVKGLQRTRVGDGDKRNWWVALEI